MDFFETLKRNIEIKPSKIDSKTIQKNLEKIPKLEKALKENPNSFDLIYQLYGCYIELSDTKKKIECLEQMQKIRPKDTFPLNQLSHIYYSELENPVKGKFYQDKANKINSNKFL